MYCIYIFIQKQKPLIAFPLRAIRRNMEKFNTKQDVLKKKNMIFMFILMCFWESHSLNQRLNQSLNRSYQIQSLN